MNRLGGLARNGSGEFAAWADCPLSLVYLAAFREQIVGICQHAHNMRKMR